MHLLVYKYEGQNSIPTKLIIGSPMDVLLLRYTPGKKNICVYLHTAEQGTCKEHLQLDLPKTGRKQHMSNGEITYIMLPVKITGGD